MMIAMAVVITQNAAIVLLRQEVIDKLKIVSSDLTILVLPDLFSNKSTAQRTADRGNLVDNLPQLALRRHNARLSQVGHCKPYLKSLKN